MRPRSSLVPTRHERKTWKSWQMYTMTIILTIETATMIVLAMTTIRTRCY